MKRIYFMVAVLVSLLMAGQAVFAQDSNENSSGFTMTGVMTTGVFVHFTDMFDQGPFIMMMGSEGDPIKFNFGTRWLASDGNAGLYLNVEASTGAITINKDQTVSVHDKKVNFGEAYGWVKGFNGLLTVYGGYWDPSLYKTRGALDSDLNMKNTGLMFEFNPVPGLYLAPSVWAKKGDTTLIGEAKYMFSAKFIQEGLFETIINYAHHQLDNLGFTNEDNSSTYREQAAKDQRVNFGFNWTGFKDIGITKLAFDFEARDLGGGRKAYIDNRTYLPAGEVVYPLYFGQWIQWQNFGFNVNLKGYQLIRIGDGVDEVRENYAPAMRFVLDVAYAVNNYIVPKVGVGYYMNSQVWGRSTDDLRFERFTDEKLSAWEDCIKDTGGIGLRIGSEFRFQGNTNRFMEVGYSMKKDLTKDAEPGISVSTIDHGFYATLRIGL